MRRRPVVALLGGAAAGARLALAAALNERLAQSGIDADLAPEIAFELPAGGKDLLPTLALLIACDDDDAPAASDQDLRDRLAREGVPYSVLYGDDAARLANAWQLLRPLLQLAPAPAGPEEPARPAWRWACDKCSDPACEHRLFQDLLAGRRRRFAPPPH